MIAVELDHAADFESWRSAARRLALAGVRPEDVHWQVRGEPVDLFATPSAPLPDPPPGSGELKVPRAFMELAERVLCHCDPTRFGLLYRLLRRLQEQPRLLDHATDDDVHRAAGMAKAVARERHKMTAFVRFRETTTEDGESAFVAWFEPEHHVVRLAAPFFRDRFANMRWSILTPDVCVHWDRRALQFTAGVSRAQAPEADRLEDYWRTYYASIFNPARLKVNAMKREMPVRYWKNLPESSLIPSLIGQAGTRATAMVAAEPTRAPKRSEKIVAPAANARAQKGAAGGLDGLRHEAEACRRCPLWANATQTVFGEGRADAALLFVGEQPGDKEDLAGKPFIGPAGQMFDRALAEAGIERGAAYVTNAVKHFKNEPRGKRRLHKSPNIGEIDACRWWIEKEAALLRPRLTIALGATAVRSLTGASHPVTRVRGKVLESPFAGDVFVTVHPSFILRLRETEDREREFAAFVKDLEQARRLAFGA